MLTRKSARVTVFTTGTDIGIYTHNTKTLYVYDSDTTTMDFIITDVDIEQANDIMKFCDTEGDESLERKYGFNDWDVLFSGVGDRKSFAEYVLVELGVIDSMDQAQCDVEDSEALADLIMEGFYI